MVVVVILVALVALLAGSIAIVVKHENRRQKRARTRLPFDRFLWGLQPLLHRMRPGARLTACPNGRDGFLELLLTGREGTWREVELGLPDADWSRARFDHAVDALREHASEWEVEHYTANPDVPRFLRVWIDGEEESVRERTAALLHAAAQALGFPASQTYNIDFVGGDHPDYMRALADRLERDPGTPRVIRKLVPFYRRKADEAERAMQAELGYRCA
jgi:hypothetical protein